MRAIAAKILALAACATGAACGGVSGGPPVEFISQRNIIVWDEDTRTEDFIRSAAFRSTAKDFGFIAPTPTIPEISVVKAAAFIYLDSLFPRMKGVDRQTGGGFGGGGGLGAPPLIIQVKEVGGYVATTLLASDARGLSKWMEGNGYKSTPQIEDWTRFYIRKGWYLTAFKVADKDGDPQTGVIKLRFKTDVPFNPYFVPRENATDRGMGLSVHFIASQPMAVRRRQGQAGFRLSAAMKLTDKQARGLLPLISRDSLPKNASLQYFVDRSFPNPTATDDLYFERAPHRIGNGLQLALEQAFGLS